MTHPERDRLRRTRWRHVLASVVVIALLGAFFSTPLSKYPTHSYSAADLTQDLPLTQVERGHEPANRLLSDPTTEMVPWLLFNRDEFRAGRIPLWNDRNANGAPHLANYQSAVFSPFSLPFYLLDLKPALLVSAFLKLAASALFTFLFLDLLGLGTLACLIGSAAFTFSGHNVLLLAYPHAAAVVALPAGLYFAELALQRAESGRRALAALAGLSATIAIGLYCGQPEPFYFSLLFVALWCAARLVAIAWREWLDRGRAWGSAWLASRVLLAALVGLAMAAPQVLPFLEYLEHSSILVWRSADQTPLNSITWPLYAFPDVLGNPSLHYKLNYSIPPPNYESANTCYIGALAMVVAGCSFFFLKHIKAARFFAPVAVLWFLYAYDVGGFGKLLASIPTIDLAPINRSQPIGLFAMSAAAAIAVHGIATRQLAARWKFALATALAGSLAMWFTVLCDMGKMRGAWVLFNRLRHSGYAKSMPPGSDAYVPEHLQFILVSFAAGLFALTLLWCLRSQFLRNAAQVVILCVIFLQSGWLLRDYNPTIEDKFVYPVTPGIAKLQRATAGEPLIVLGAEPLPPHVNLVYGLAILASYDAMWVRKYDELYRESFGLAGDNWRLALQTTSRWIRQFGVRFVVSPGSWVKVDSLCDQVLISPSDLYRTPEILPGGDLVQTILGHRERLQGVALQFATTPLPVRCTVEARLEDTISGQVIATKTWRTDEWRNDRFGRHEILFDFEPMLDARHRPLRLTISSPDATPGNAISLWAREDYWYWNQFVLLEQPMHDVISTVQPGLRRPGRRPHGHLTVAGQVLRGGLMMDQTYEQEHWNRVDSVAGFVLAELKNPLPRYSTVSRGIATRRIGDDFKLVHQGNLDPHHVVVLSLPAHGAIDSSRGKEEVPEPAVEVLHDDPDHAVLRVIRETPGYLVLRRAYFPGWEARLNGKFVPVLRADYAFCAIELPAGVSQVEFDYQPASFRIGLWIAALAPLLGGFLLWLSRGRGRIVPWSA
ncbi:MAG TPA: YfhO family protein [Planctomycetota bacterium]|nr:YfhO family protein [Planctomycetota bacterium]